MKKIMVLGGGYMGSGIAQACAAAGHDVLLWDISEELIMGGIEKIRKSLDKRVEKGKETKENRDAILARITPATSLAGAAGADMILEAIIEKQDIKEKVFSDIEKHCRPDTCIGTNTSYLSITELATALERPERFLGIHFFGPVPAMRLIELIKGDKTEDAAVDTAREFALSIGKTPVVVKKDSTGFLVNRINAAIRTEAYKCYEEGIASISDIDTAMKLGLNHPMGPFELNDMAGIEIGLSGLEALYENTGEERWKPIDRAYELVKNGELGRKTGKGWYDYSSGEKKIREDVNEPRG